MNAKEFTETVGDFFDRWLMSLANSLVMGTAWMSSDRYSFPKVLRVAETPHHFIAELCGAHKPIRPEKARLQRPTATEKFKSTAEFFNCGFKFGEGAFKMSDGTQLQCMTLATGYDEEVYRRKIQFPLHDTINKSRYSNTPLEVPPHVTKCLLSDVTIVRTDDVRVLYRTIHTAVCAAKTGIRPSELTQWLQAVCVKSFRDGRSFGLDLRYSPSSYSFGRELCSLLDQNVTEPILDSFIRSHGHYFKKALGYTDLLTQPSLPWVSRTDSDPIESIPDYLLKRPDGYWDILDLKRAALRYKSIVRGMPARPRFIDYVSEMIAQLVRYRTYFDAPANAQWAKVNLGVDIKHVKLVGVVGNYDTFDSHEVGLAMKQYSEDIVVMSYSDIINLLRASDSKR